MEQMDGGIAIFQNTKIVYRNGDTEYPYRSNSDFYYLTGFDYPDAAFILLPNEDKKFIIEMMVPGNKCFEGFQRAEEVVKEGLYRLGLITDKNSTWQYKAYYYPYISHGLGLDAHDVGDYGGYREGGRMLEPGMVLTIEPGFYIGDNMIDVFRMIVKRSASEEEVENFIHRVKPVFEKYKNTGIRIEDDVLITEQGNEVLFAKTEKTVR